MAVANKHIEKAERLLQKSKIEAALEEYLLAWQEEPENDAIVYTVAELYQKLNRNVQSKECYVFLFDKAVERNDAQKVLELTRKMQLVGVLEPARLITAAQQLEKQRPDLASEQYFGLDPVGTRFWQLLTEERPLSEIVHTMAGEFAVAREELERDLDDLLARLSEAGLVRMIDSASG